MADAQFPNNEYTNADLYNCCNGLEAPNWAEYIHLTLEGCIRVPIRSSGQPEEGEYEIQGHQDRIDAEFFTIYGWNCGSHAITDVASFEEALRIAKCLSDISGLEIQTKC